MKTLNITVFWLSLGQAVKNVVNNECWKRSKVHFISWTQHTNWCLHNILNLEIFKNLVALTFVAKAWERLSKLEKLLKYWNLKDTGASYNRVFTDNTAKSSQECFEKNSEIKENLPRQNILTSVFAYVLLASSKHLFLKE